MLNLINNLIIIQSTFEEQVSNTAIHDSTPEQIQNQIDDLNSWKRGWRCDILNRQTKEERFEYLCNPDTREIEEIQKCIQLLEDWKDYDDDKATLSQVRLTQKIVMIQSDIDFGKVEYVK